MATEYGQNKNSVLIAGVPLERGNPIHVEHADDQAFTLIKGDGTVVEIHTPQEPMLRVHEHMHSVHTDNNHRPCEGVYRNANFFVGNIVEDCRLHMTRWPWRAGRTPQVIEASADKVFRREKAQIEKELAKAPAARGQWPDFAIRMRRVAIKYGLGRGWGRAVKEANFATYKQRDLASEMLNQIIYGHEQYAAEVLQKAFFDPIRPPEVERPKRLPGDEECDEGDEALGEDAELYDDEGCRDPEMEIIELKHTVKIKHPRCGQRRAVMGPRLHRPSLRKPVLPQRLFVKRSPMKPGGTILIDASGSMGDFEQIATWAEQAPYGTIAYYAGRRDKGQLFIYARDGYKSAEIVRPDGGDNVVDGPAMSWLMKQRKPRIMITDRGFCSASDSSAQIIRLERLEALGEIEVRNYRDEERLNIV